MSRILYEIIPDSKDIDRELVLAAKYGMAFEYNDFMNPDQLDDKEYCRQKIVFYKNLGRNMSNDTLHGAFIDLVVQSTDSLIRDASRKRVYQSMEIAQALGVRGVVFHTGLIPNYKDESYMKSWRDGCVRFWRKVLEDFPEQSVYIENMFDMDASGMAALGEGMKDQERFGCAWTMPMRSYLEEARLLKTGISIRRHMSDICISTTTIENTISIDRLVRGALIG